MTSGPVARGLSCPSDGWRVEHVCRQAAIDAFVLHIEECHRIDGGEPWVAARARRAVESHGQCTDVCVAPKNRHEARTRRT